MIDLDVVELRFGKAAAYRWQGSVEHAQMLREAARNVPLLVAELRAAREVVEAARGLGAIVAGDELTQAIIAWEKVVSDG